MAQPPAELPGYDEFLLAIKERVGVSRLRAHVSSNARLDGVLKASGRPAPTVAAEAGAKSNVAFGRGRVQRSRSRHREPAPSATYLLIAARVYTRRIRSEINEDGQVGWSCPRHLRKGDLALLYEMGKPDEPDDVPGRKEVRWLYVR